jgi:transcriptional regulator with XRE-family HTH domain
LGGIIPRNVKNRVIHQWVDGLTREEIARENDIGAGTVTAIIQDARKHKEYNDIDLLRQISIKLRVEGLDSSSLAFAIRLKNIMEDNGINEDQIEPIIQDFATYRLRHKISYDDIIKSGREALYLEQTYDIPIEKIPQYITQGKKRIDRLEDQIKEILAEAQFARMDRDAKQHERDIIAAEIEKYKMEIPSIQRIKELENALEEEKRKNEAYKIGERVLIKERDSADREATRSAAEVIELDASLNETKRRLSVCQNELGKLNKNQQIDQS